MTEPAPGFDPGEYGPAAAAMIAAALAGDDFTIAKITTRWDGTLLATVMAEAAAGMLRMACADDNGAAQDVAALWVDSTIRARARQVQ